MYATRAFIKEVCGRKVVCPHCNTASSFSAVRRYGSALELEDSREDRFVFIDVGYDAYVTSNGKWKAPNYAIGQCPTCAGLFVLEHEDHGSVRIVWPLPNSLVSDKVPEPVYSAVRDAKLSLAAASITGAVMSLRTAVERIQRQKCVENLKELWQKEQLPPALYGTADENRLWGNMVAHVDFDPATVTLSDVEELMDLFDMLLDILYVKAGQLADIKCRRERIQDNVEE